MRRFKMRLSILNFIALWFLITGSSSDDPPCEISYNDLLCRKFEINKEEPIQVIPKVKSLVLKNVKGAIGVKTLSPFPEVEELELDFPEVDEIEKGALCSLPKLKSLEITDNEFPILTKDHLTGCNHVERFKCDVPLEDGALEGMTGLKALSLQALSRHDTRFKKEFLTPLRNLEFLILDLHQWDSEPGLFCTQPTLEKLSLESRTSLNLTESFLEGCNNLKYIYVGSYAVVPEGQYPFRSMKQLEQLILGEKVTDHITKEFLDGLPNLKELAIEGFTDKRLTIDEDAFIGAPNILNLRLGRNALESSDLVHLHDLSELRKLELEHNNIKDLNALPSLPKLEDIYIPYNKIRKFDFGAFKKKFPSLKWLYMMDNPFDPAFVEELSLENDIMIRTSYNGIVNRNKSLLALFDQHQAVFDIHKV